MSALPIPSFIHKDLVWWKLFLAEYNDISIMLLEEWSQPDENFSCAACPSGCVSLIGSSYFHEIFPMSISERQLRLNALERLTIVVALKIWGRSLKGKKVLILCDSMSSCNLINKGLSRDKFHQSCSSRKLLRIKVTPDLHLTYSKNWGNLGLVLKMKNIACISILLTKYVKYTYLYLFKCVFYSIVAFKAN